MMLSFQEKLTETNEFLFGIELVSSRGSMQEGKVKRIRDLANQLSAHSRLSWVSITDNAGGNPMLAPPALGRPILYSGMDVVIHLSCKDFNRNGLESESWHLASEGFHNILALSGDYPVAGEAGAAKPVFDIDSIGLLSMLRRMNGGLETRTDGGEKRTLSKTQFFAGAAVTNFKRHENEVVPQLLKLEKKIACGARFIINQIGYDSRKMHELILYMKHRGLDAAPLIGNVYLLNGVVAKIFNSNRIPGVVLTDVLLELCQKQAASPDKGRLFFQEFAAKQIAIFRGLGYRGAYLCGIHKYEALDAILNIESKFSPDDWKEFAKEILFSRPGEFFLYPEDPATKLAIPGDFQSGYLQSLAQRPATKNVTLNYKLSKKMHDWVFTPGRGLAPLGARLCKNSTRPEQGPWLLRKIEHASKALLFGCKDCGDCSLPDTAFLCPESQCAKNQRNGPCGGTRDGLCEVHDFECIWGRAYDRLKYEGRAEQLLDHAPAIQDQSLRGTSSWSNAWLEKDYRARNKKSSSGEASEPSDDELNAEKKREVILKEKENAAK